MKTATVPRERARHPLTGRLALGCLIAALLLAPLPLGSNRPWSLALLGGLVWLGMCLAAWGWALSPRQGSGAATLKNCGALLLFALGFCAWCAGQYGLSQMAGLGHLTEDGFASRHFLLRSLVYVGAMVLCLWVVNSRRRVKAVLFTVVASGLAQAMLAALLHAGAARYEFMFEPFEQGARATGTFVNPDHLAGYMLVCLSAAFGLLLSQLGRGQEAMGWQQRLAQLAAFLVSAKMLLRLALVVMVIALVLTRSRMGNAAFLISIVVTALLVAWGSVRHRRPALWLVASMLLIDVLIIGQWVGLDKVAARMSGTAEASSTTIASFGLEGVIPPPKEQSLAERMEVPAAALPLVWQRPVMGWGGGSFGLAFAPIKPASAYSGFWDHAHNDYVQVAVETGLVGFALWMGIGLVTAWRAMPLLSDQQAALSHGVAVAALASLCSVGLHSMVDFVLYLPANALTLSVLLALVWVAPWLPNTTARATRPASHGVRRQPSLDA